MIRLYDTKTRSKQNLETLERGKVGMYVCGPTVYNRIHIGNARTFISFDVIRRYLMWRGFDVTFVQNVTDVDDKIIAKAAEEGRDAADVAAEYTEAFIEDMRAAGVLDPDVRPKATEEIPAMIELVQELIDGGHAYEVDGDVYFAVRSYPAYGELSAATSTRWRAGIASCAPRSTARGTWPTASAIRSISRCGRRPSRRARVGVARGGWAGPVGTSSARPCRASTWACRSTSTAAVPTSCSRTTERARAERGRVRLRVREPLDARRHAAGELREDEQVARQLQAAARRARDDRSRRAALPHAADALPQPARLLRRTPAEADAALGRIKTP